MIANAFENFKIFYKKNAIPVNRSGIFINEIYGLIYKYFQLIIGKRDKS